MKVVYEYANYMAGHGHSITIYYMADQFLVHRRFAKLIPEFARRMAAKALTAWQPRWFALNSTIRKKAVFDAEDVAEHDVIVATAIMTSFFVNSLPEKCGKKAYFIQGLENWKVSLNVVYETYAMGMKNITVAKWLSQIVDMYSKEPSICISNGINQDVFYVRKPLEERPRHSIVFQYRDAPYKGCKYALETVRMLRERYPDLSVTVISNVSKKPDLPGYFTYVHNATSEEVARINNEAVIFICSSIKEGFGLPGLEAMACGCALVSTEYEGVLEYAVDGVNALLSPVEDSKAMADNVARLFEDDALLRRIVRGGISTAKGRDFVAGAKKFEETLYELL